MSAASVFNPMPMSVSVSVPESRHARTAPVSLPLPVPVPVQVRVPVPALSSLRRNLFGSADDDECRSLIERELQETLARQSNYWEFDFKNDVPRSDAVRFKWQAMADKCPASRPRKRAHQDAQLDADHLYFEPLHDKPDVLHKLKQPRITDFLKTKKHSPHQSPLYQKKLLGKSPSSAVSKIASYSRRKS